MEKSNKAVVLVIDDEQTYLNVITKTLKERNYKILQALDGKMGCMVAKKFIPDIIIIDWEMPEMNGIEAIIDLKQNESTSDIPIIMCTGIMTSSQNLDTALNAGAVDYIRKPVEPIELISRINSALSISKAIKEIKNKKEQIEEQKVQIEQKNQELEELVATKDKFFSIIAHDLKNPLNIILGFSNLLVSRFQQFDFVKIKEFVGHISNTANETYKLLENLLDWARLQNGLMIPELKRYNLLSLIDEEFDILKQMAQNKKINLVNQINDEQFVICDKEMTKTIIRNIVSNAIKYSNEGGEVQISSSQKDSALEISVKDSGVGIADDRINYLFKIEKNISTPGTLKERGTGLGLILCKELIEKQGGKIWVTSEKNKGSDFSFSLNIPLDYI